MSGDQNRQASVNLDAVKDYFKSSAVQKNTLSLARALDQLTGKMVDEAKSQAMERIDVKFKGQTTSRALQSRSAMEKAVNDAYDVGGFQNLTLRRS